MPTKKKPFTHNLNNRKLPVYSNVNQVICPIKLMYKN